MNDQYEHVRKMGGLDIFERRTTPTSLGGYKFVMPGVMIGADDVQIDIRDGVWHLRHEVDGATYNAAAESLWGAYLALIGDRMGLIVTSEPKPEPADG